MDVVRIVRTYTRVPSVVRRRVRRCDRRERRDIVMSSKQMARSSLIMLRFEMLIH